MVGKTPQVIAKLAGISVPDDARVLIADGEGVGNNIHILWKNLLLFLVSILLKIGKKHVS